MRTVTSRSTWKFGGAAVVIAGAIAVLASGCGYALAGRGNTLPAYVKTIGIPQFLNQSQTPDIHSRFSAAIRDEFRKRGKFTVVEDVTGADATLIGVITSTTLAPAGTTSSSLASRYAISVTATIEFKDLQDNNKVLCCNPLFLREEYNVTRTTSTTDVASFLRQDDDAFERLAASFAKTVVTTILEAF